MAVAVAYGATTISKLAGATVHLSPAGPKDAAHHPELAHHLDVLL